MNFFQDTKIRTRLFYTSGVIFVLFLLAISLYQRTINRVQTTFLQILEEEHIVADQAVEIGSLIAQAGKAEKDFMLTKDLRHTEQVAEVIQLILRKCDEIQSYASSRADDALVTVVGNIARSARSYATTFQKVVATHEMMGLDENSGLQGNFRKASHDLEVLQLQEHAVGDLLLILQQLRRAEESFLSSNSPQDKTTVLEALDKLTNQSQNKNMQATYAATLQENLHSYQQALQRHTPGAPEELHKNAAAAMRQSRKNVETLLESIYIPNITGLSLEIRRREKDYLLRLQDQYVDQTHKAIAELRAAFKKKNLDQEEDTKEALQFLNTYKYNFDALVRENKKISQLHDTLQQKAAQVEQEVNTIISQTDAATRKNAHKADTIVRIGSRIAIAISLAALFLGTLFSLLIARSILTPLQTILDGLAGLSRGDYTTRITARPNDETETGILAAMFNQMGAAIGRHNWLSQGRNQLAEELRGDKSEETICRDVVTFLARYTNAQVGVVYVADENNILQRRGSYALEGGAEAQLPASIQLGAGLIGEAAAGKKIIRLSELPDTYLRITSSLGSAPPRNLLALPIVWKQETLAVIELASLQAFSEDQLTFLEQTTEPIAIALNSCHQRRKTQNLLEETQQLAEELQSQQEALKASNEELEEQTQSLRQNEEELQAANEEMEEKNETLIRQKQEIQQKAQELETASRYKSEFLANMSHELRTPLNSLLLLARNLANNKTGNLDAGQIESATIIHKSGKDLLCLINDILDLSKIEAGQMKISPAPINLPAFEDWLYDNFRHMVADKDIAFQVKREPNLPEPFVSDRLRLEQILRNLVANAIKFTDQGQITVTFSRVDEETDTSGKQPFLAIAVADSGIGIAPADQRIIFDAFKQVDGGTTRKYEGTGLGLSIVRNLTAMLGGRITLQSEPGQGSTFTILLPAKPPAEFILPPNKPLMPPATGLFRDLHVSVDIPDDRDQLQPTDKSILIIEDDLSFAKILMDLGHEKGFQCLAAATGDKGLALAEEYRPSAILLDICLPDTDGWRILDTLKQNPAVRHIPVHILSCEESDIEAFRKGAIGFLTKPVSEDDLQKTFAKLQDAADRRIRNLLVIEDDKVLRNAIMTLIGNGDVTTTPAENGTEALKLLQEKHFDCMILDIGLPDMSGFTLLEKLEAKTDITIPPVIIYTGRELTREENDLLRRFTDSVIIKGVKSEERLLDETALFLHRVIENLPREKRQMIASLYEQDTMFQNKRILVVDDDMRNAFALSRILEERGMQVSIANDGQRALDLLDKNPKTDLILMDIMMPEMDGCETMQKIRAMQQLQTMPIIALTAKAMPEDREKCMAAGASDYLAKPVDESRLLSMMRVWLYR